LTVIVYLLLISVLRDDWLRDNPDKKFFLLDFSIDNIIDSRTTRSLLKTEARLFGGIDPFVGL